MTVAQQTPPADITSIAIVQGPGAPETLAMIQRSPRGSSIHAQVLERDPALQGLRLGKFDLLVVPDGQGGFEYRYDPARPESVLSHAEVDDALQAAAGRKDPLSTTTV